jgi:hypothetical protein
MEYQDNGALRLTNEQAAEVRQRLASPSPKPIPAAEVFRQFRSSCGFVRACRDVGSSDTRSTEF